MPISTRRVNASGPRHADIAFVGEGPGREEDRRGQPFVGASGKILRAMARMYAGIDLRDAYVTNLSKYRLTDDRGKDRAPTEEEAKALAPDLHDEIVALQPSLVVTLGRWSTWAMTDLKAPMSVLNGRVLPWAWGTVVPVTHPAAGLHSPQFLHDTVIGLETVGRFLMGDAVSPVVDAHPKPSYSYWPETRLPITFHRERPVSIDTEDPLPGTIQWSDTPGIARMIRADDKKLVGQFRDALLQARPTIVLHHALHDLKVMKKFGIDILAMGLPIRDTMIELFLLQTEPQGLKEASARLCGMAMREYEDVVGPVAEKIAQDYLAAVIAEPPVEWAFGEGRKHSPLKRVEGLIRPRPTRGEAKTIRQKWADEDSFGKVREAVEAVAGPMPEPSLDDIPTEEFVPYACADADGTTRLSTLLPPRIDADGLREVHRIDHGALPLIARMQEVGMLVDTEALGELRDYLRDEKAIALDVCRAIVGDAAFNPGSGDQVAAYCVAKGLKLDKMTKSGKRIQVDENQLTLIRFDDDAIEWFLRYRELDKLEGTYTNPMPKFLVGTGRYRRIHPTFRTTATITGRLAIGGESSPPFLGMPTRSEDGRRVRSVVVAKEGCVLGSADLSQIELRVGAGVSQDAEMMDAFSKGVDLHTRTASKLFGKPIDQIDDMKERYPCKTANFAIFYGARAYRLNAEFLKAGIPGFDMERCDEFVKEWFALYEGVERWIADTYSFGAKYGYITTAAGRRRYVPGLRFEGDEYPFGKVREEAQRQASNFPIQGTAQEIIKKAMPAVDATLASYRSAGFYAEPLLQVHDEILVEVDEAIAGGVGEEITAALTAESPWKGVPLKASWKTAANWAGLKG